MFTGIVLNQGKIVRKETRGGQVRFAIKFKTKEKNKLKLGESIATDGVCLTASKVVGQTFYVDVIRDTLEATSLGKLELNDLVNLERSLKVGDEIGGHFVTGHVDACGRVVAIRRAGKNVQIEIAAPDSLIRMLAPKGSVALDGISLTVQHVKAKTFDIGIVPHTLRETTLGAKKVGDPVNLEIDLIARYLQTLLKAYESKPKSGPRLKVPALKRQGF